MNRTFACEVAFHTRGSEELLKFDRPVTQARAAAGEHASAAAGAAENKSLTVEEQWSDCGREGINHCPGLNSRV